MENDIDLTFKNGLLAIYCKNSEEQEKVIKIAIDKNIKWKNGQEAKLYKPYIWGFKKVYIYIKKGKLLFGLKKPSIIKCIEGEKLK